MAFNPLKADEELGAVGHQQIDALTFSPEKADKALFNDDSVARQTINSNPEQEARFNDLSKKHGYQLDTVRRKTDDIEAVDLADRIKSASPTTRAAFQDVDFARLAHKDIENLSYIEGIFKGLGGSISESFKQAGRGVRVGATDSTSDRVDNLIPASVFPPGISMLEQQMLSRSLAAEFGIDNDGDLADAKEAAQASLFSEIKAGKEKIAELTPEDLSILQEGIRGGIHSLSVQAPLFAATLLSRSPVPMLAGMGSFEGFGAYGEARSEGLEHGQASLYAGTNASIEVLTELIPASQMVKALGPGWKSAISKFAIGELTGEQIATFTQSLNAYAHGLDEELENAVGLREKAEVQSRRQAVTFVSTLVAGGTQIGIASGAGALINRSEAGQKKLEELNQYLEQSALRESNPEKFRELIAKMSEEGVTDTIYLDAEGANVYFQGMYQGENILVGDDFKAAQDIKDQIESAIEEGRRIEIPIEVYATDIVGTDLQAGLAAHITMNSDALTQGELESADIQANIAELTKQSHEDRVENTEVYNEILGQQLAISTDRSTAETNAIVWEAHFKTWADRPGIKAQGLTPMDLLKRQFPSIGREVDPRLQKRMKAVTEADTLINMMRDGDVPQNADIFGESIIPYIMSQGGITDIGGELSALDVDEGKDGRFKRVITEGGDTLDGAAEYLMEAGYITERTEQAVVDAVAAELRGDPVYAMGNENTDLQSLQSNLNTLGDAIDQAGIDIDTMTNEEILTALGEVADPDALTQAIGDAIKPLPVASEQDFSDIQVVEEVTIEETGETVEATESAQAKFEAMMQRRDAVEQIRNCIGG